MALSKDAWLIIEVDNLAKTKLDTAWQGPKKYWISLEGWVFAAYQTNGPPALIPCEQDSNEKYWKKLKILNSI